MHLTFAPLLAFLFVTSSVDALPIAAPAGYVTLPLTRIPHRTDVHPLIHLQQRMNRGQRRLAYMSGHGQLSVDQMTRNLYKRLLAVEGPEGLKKRYNRFGLPKASKTGESFLAKDSLSARHRKKKANTGAVANSTANANSTIGGNDSQNGVTVANTPQTANSLGLDIEANDVGYLATVQMGTPPRNFLILMDSGSADLWVGAENCKSQDGGGCGQHLFLGSQSSSSFQDSGNPFSVTYGTGKVTGTIIQDDITVAGLQLQGHTFGVAAVESVDFSSDNTPFDGLMGLAQSTLSEQQTPTPIEALAAAGLVPAAITSFKISRVADNKNDGEITFGALDTSKFDSNTLITLNNVNQQGFWEANMDAVTVNGQDVGLQGRTAILDTGTTLIIAPAQDAAAVHAAIPGAASDGQGGFTIPCTSTVKVALSFGQHPFAIDTRDLLVQPVDANNPNGTCVSGIASGNIGGATEWLVGDVFLKNAYFSTDVGKNTVSLAQLI